MIFPFLQFTTGKSAGRHNNSHFNGCWLQDCECEGIRNWFIYLQFYVYTIMCIYPLSSWTRSRVCFISRRIFAQIFLLLVIQFGRFIRLILQTNGLKYSDMFLSGLKSCKTADENWLPSEITITIRCSQSKSCEITHKRRLNKKHIPIYDSFHFFHITFHFDLRQTNYLFISNKLLQLY